MEAVWGYSRYRLLILAPIKVQDLRTIILTFTLRNKSLIVINILFFFAHFSRVKQPGQDAFDNSKWDNGEETVSFGRENDNTRWEQILECCFCSI